MWGEGGGPWVGWGVGWECGWVGGGEGGRVVYVYCVALLVCWEMLYTRALFLDYYAGMHMAVPRF